MKKMVLAVLVLSLGSALSTEPAERWSAEQRDVLSQIDSCWAAWAEAAQAKDISIWERACPASDDLLWWWTSDAVPTNRRSISRQFRQWDFIERVVWWDVRPIEVTIIGEMAIVPFYSRGSWLGTDGERVDFSSKRVELFRKVDGRWTFLGGMVDPETQAP